MSRDRYSAIMMVPCSMDNSMSIQDWSNKFFLNDQLQNVKQLMEEIIIHYILLQSTVFFSSYFVVIWNRKILLVKFALKVFPKFS